MLHSAQCYMTFTPLEMNVNTFVCVAVRTDEIANIIQCVTRYMTYQDISSRDVTSITS